MPLTYLTLLILRNCHLFAQRASVADQICLSPFCGCSGEGVDAASCSNMTGRPLPGSESSDPSNSSCPGREARCPNPANSLRGASRGVLQRLSAHQQVRSAPKAPKRPLKPPLAGDAAQPRNHQPRRHTVAPPLSAAAATPQLGPLCLVLPSPSALPHHHQFICYRLTIIVPPLAPNRASRPRLFFFFFSACLSPFTLSVTFYWLRRAEKRSRSWNSFHPSCGRSRSVCWEHIRRRTLALFLAPCNPPHLLVLPPGSSQGLEAITTTDALRRATTRLPTKYGHEHRDERIDGLRFPLPVQRRIVTRYTTVGRLRNISPATLDTR
ncbi:hypothetical protein V8C26DRAFT_349762 [Trichoderma gracile]